jgi:8-oxoguanine deaminase
VKSLLAKNAEVLVTMDDKRRELKNAGLYAEDGVIKQVGPTEELPNTADVVLNLSGQIVLPGLVNTHHHLNQTLVRNLPAAQNNNLFPWLRAQYRIWAGTTPEASRVSTLIGLAELALSGCTMVFDHSYIFKNGNTVDCQIEAAKEIGVRFHASRGSMSLGESKGGLPPDDCVEEEDFILRDSQRVIEKYHDASPGAMTRIVLAPCSPFSVSSDLLKETAALARSLKAMLHTHLCETFDEERYTLERFQLRPVDWMETVNWLGDDVWFAHGIHVDEEEIGKFAHKGCGIAHCPSSNMRLASGIAPVKQYMAAGVKVGLGVDGSSSNDSSHMLQEVRQAMCRTKRCVPERQKAHGGDIEAWIRLPSQRRKRKRRRSVRLGPRHKSGATGLPLKSGLCVFRAQPLACHQQLRGRRGRDHGGIFSLHFSQANWTNEFRKALSRQTRGAHLAQEARPLRRRAYEADIAKPIRAQGLRDDFEIDRVRMGHDDNQRAVGRIREFVRRLRSVDQRDIRRPVGRKSLATRVDPADRERQRRER